MMSNRFLKTRVIALERDNYTCQKCGKHITPKRTCYAVHHLSYESDEPENLLTLCQSCHGTMLKKPEVAKTTISIEDTTRDRLADIGKKRESYDDIIQRLLAATQGD